MIHSIFKDFNSLNSVVFRVDAGRRKGLSFGHLARCLLLSQALRSTGVTTRFLMKDNPEGVEEARKHGEHVVEFDHVIPSEALQADVLVLDLPFSPEPEICDAVDNGLPVVFIDDTGRDELPASVVVNGSVLADAGQYPRAERVLFGPEFFIMDERYRAHQHIAPPDVSPRILMTFGGSDPTDVSLRVLQALTATREELPRLTLVLGPGYVASREFAILVGTINTVLHILHNPPDMFSLLEEHHAAFCAGGNTLYEFHAHGIPVAAVATAPHEQRTVEAFMESGRIQHGMMSFEPESFLRILRKLAEIGKGKSS